jgi:hypothetical protein
MEFFFINFGSRRGIVALRPLAFSFTLRTGREVLQAVSRRFPSTVQVMWDLWWTKQHWGRFSPSISVSPANHSCDCSTLFIIHHPGLVQWAKQWPRCQVDLVPPSKSRPWTVSNRRNVSSWTLRASCLSLSKIGVKIWSLRLDGFVKKKTHGLSPRANYTDRATAASRRNVCQLLRIKGATWSVWRIPTAVFSVF